MKHLILCFIASFICLSVTAQDYFQQSIDDTTLSNEQIFLNKIVPAPNGNFFVSGYEKWLIGNDEFYKAIVMMIDSNGNMLWNKIFDKDSSLTLSAVVPFPDGCYVIGDFFPDYSYPILMKLDLEGNVTGSNIMYNSDPSSFSIDNMVAYNGGVLFSGGNAINGDNVFLFKIDEAGNFTTMGGFSFYTGFIVTTILADGMDFYLLGWMWNGGTVGGHLKNGIIARVNGEGNLLWAKKFKLDGGYGRTSVRMGSVNEDHTVNVVYDASDLFHSNTKVGLNRVDSNGNFLGGKKYGDSLWQEIFIKGMSVSAEKKITICAGYESSSSDTTLVFRLDENVNAIWVKSSGISALSLSETAGGNLMFSGTNPSTMKGVIWKITPDGEGCSQQDFYSESFNKPVSISDLTNYSPIDSSFILSPVSLTESSPLVSYFGCDTLATAVIEPISSPPHLFPNPFNHTFRLTPNANSEITIYDVAGRLRESHKNITGEFFGGEELFPGIYFIEIENPSGVRELLKVVKTE